MTYEVGCVIVHTWYNGREAFINISHGARSILTTKNVSP